MKDDPKEWKDEFSGSPSNFDKQLYQDKIDAITGKANGHPILRVVWGAEMERTEVTGFTSLGTAAQERVIGTHRTRVKGVKGKVRIKRWIFEQWNPPEQIGAPGYVRVPGAGGLYLPPQMVEASQKGFWEKWYPVCDHTKCLPEDCDSTEYFCFGDYREPDQSDLDKIARITRRKFENGVNDPFTPVSPNAVAKANRQGLDQQAELIG